METEKETINHSHQQPSLPEITHLVISGGGPSFLQVLGNIQALEGAIIDPKKIKAIYASSSGAIVALFFCIYRDMGFTWEEINTYIIQRPWQDVFPMKMDSILSAYSKRGMFDVKNITQVFASFFNAKYISTNITLREFYDAICRIELHFCVLDINQFQLEDISYLTHPDVSLFQAILMTCAIPIIFTPVIMNNSGNGGVGGVGVGVGVGVDDIGNNVKKTKKENQQTKCYIDGGVIMNYPLKLCLGLNNDIKKENILGFKNKYDREKVVGQTSYVTEESTLFDFMMTFCFRVIHQMENKEVFDIPYEIENETDFLDAEYIKNALFLKEFRAELIEKGRKVGQEFAQSINK